MKEDKICFKKNLLYLFFISVFAVLFVVTVNYLSSQKKAVGTRASGCQLGLSECGDGTLAGQCSKSSGKNNGYRCGCFGGTSYATLKYEISSCPKLSLIPTSTVTVEETLANIRATCQAIKGKVSRTITNYGGPGVNGYDHFNGEYFSTTTKTPDVTPIPGSVWSAYCATERKITRSNVTTEGVSSCGTTVCAGGEAQGTCAKTVASRRCMCPTGTTYARYITDESCILPTP